MTTGRAQGQLWGVRARDYADYAEETFRPLFEAVLDAAGVTAGTRLLDVGCGTGLATAIAAECGALVAGLDEAERSLAIAQERAPQGDFRVGDLSVLPWPDRTFDVVTGFNAFQFAEDIVTALREARRVTLPGGKVGFATWGRGEECEIGAVAPVYGRFFPPPPPGGEGPFAIGVPGRIEALLEQADLTPVTSGEQRCVFDFPDREAALRGLLSVGPAVAAGRIAGDEAVREAMATAIERFRTPTGGYRLRNRLRYVIATV